MKNVTTPSSGASEDGVSRHKRPNQTKQASKIGMDKKHGAENAKPKVNG